MCYLSCALGKFVDGAAAEGSRCAAFALAGERQACLDSTLAGTRVAGDDRAHRGPAAEKNPPAILVDANGVGYEIDVPMSTFYQLPSISERVVLLTHLTVRRMPINSTGLQPIASARLSAS